jgi:hypothetical protein
MGRGLSYLIGSTRVRALRGLRSALTSDCSVLTTVPLAVAVRGSSEFPSFVCGPDGYLTTGLAQT